jgi:hypothetical protein
MRERYLNCDYTEGKAGEDNIEDDDLLNETARILAEGSEEGAKSAQAKQCGEQSGCSELEEFNPAEILRDAQKDASEANKDLLEARQSLRENTKKGERSIVKIEQQAREDQRSYQNSLEKINQGLAAAEKKLNQEQREAVAKKRAELTAKQAELSGLNDALRTSELEVAKAQTAWTATCLKDANSKLEAEKAEQKKKYEDSKAKGEKRNYAGSSLAGAAKRKESTLKRRQQLAFNNAYKECIAGISPAGAAADQAIKDARAALEAAKVSIAEKKEVIAKQVQDLMKDLIDQETAAAENRETLRKNAELQLKEATDAYNSSVERATILRAQAMEDLADVKSFGQEAINLATTNANQATGRLQMAESRVQCGGNKTVTSATASRNQTAYEDINEYSGVSALYCANKDYSFCSWHSGDTCNRGEGDTAPAKDSTPPRTTKAVK